eukprot:scaffold35886_cov275-Amphora_coffeaeformis.AAC.1
MDQAIGALKRRSITPSQLIVGLPLGEVVGGDVGVSVSAMEGCDVVGLSDGDWEGAIVTGWLVVGDVEGARVGTRVGFPVGWLVVGDVEGARVGAFVGFRVGWLVVGDVEGARVGTRVGFRVEDDSVGAADGDLFIGAGDRSVLAAFAAATKSKRPLGVKFPCLATHHHPYQKCQRGSSPHSNNAVERIVLVGGREVVHVTSYAREEASLTFAPQRNHRQPTVSARFLERNLRLDLSIDS